MSKAICLGSLATALVLAGSMGFTTLVQADGATNDSLACYSWSAFPDERINLNIRGGGPLSAAAETMAQRTHGIHGKHVGSCGEDTNSALVGVLVFKAGTGSTLGIYSPQSRGKEKFNADDVCRSVTIECYSNEVSKTPAEWTCQSRNEFDVYHGESKLELIAIDVAPDDPLCGVFEDKDAFEDSNENDSGVASGMRAENDD
ncbi:MAG: hypothetical protein ABFS39_00060 [Pseudomonadota bacterium]